MELPPLIITPRYIREGFSPKMGMNTSMSVTGSKVGIFQSPREKPAQMSRNGLQPREFMSVQDYVKTVSGKSQFGHTFYDPPSNEMLQKKIPLGISSKEKNMSFAEQVMKKKAWVPGPIYNREIDWNKTIPKNTGKFLRKARDTVTDDIYTKAKSKEKSVVGPNHYKEDEQWSKAATKRKVNVGFFKW